MGIQQLKKSVEKLKTSAKERPLSYLLTCDPSALTDEELDRLLKEVPVTRAPVDFLLESIERQCKEFFGDDYDKINSIDDIPDKYIQTMKENLNRVAATGKARY
jgi:hypothetical protein